MTDMRHVASVCWETLEPVHDDFQTDLLLATVTAINERRLHEKSNEWSELMQDICASRKYPVADNA